MMKRRQIREQMIALLDKGDFSGLVALSGEEESVARELLHFLYDPGDLRQWRALEGLGYVAEAQPQQVKKLIGRLLYLLNEDSGSTGWGAAAALGEIGRRQLPLVEDILPMFCGFLEQRFSREPMLWGLGRLGEVHPQALAEVLPLIPPLLVDPEPQVRGLAAWVLGKVKPETARSALQALSGDDCPVQLYEHGQWRRTTVGRLAQEALTSPGP
jgi:HEAT repeat protein